MQLPKLLEKLREEWTKFLRRYRWTFFLTLTTKKDYAPDSLNRLLLEFLADLEGILGKRWWWAYAQEGGEQRRCHAHLLIGGVPVQQRAKIEAAWRHGRTECTDAKDRANAEAYLTKCIELAADTIDIDPEINRKLQSWCDRAKNHAQKEGQARSANRRH